MLKYLPILVPITFYILIGWTAYTFSQPLVLLFLLISPRADTSFYIAVGDNSSLTKAVRREGTETSQIVEKD